MRGEKRSRAPSTWSAGSVSTLTSLGSAMSAAHTSTWLEEERSRRIVLTSKVTSSWLGCRHSAEAR